MRDWLVSTLGGGATALAIVVAVIGLAGALGGASTSYLIGQQTVYINSITAERMKWVTLLRSNLATFMTIVERIRTNSCLGKHKDLDVVMKDVSEVLQLRHKLALQLNPGGLIDGVLIQIVDALVNSTQENDHKNVTTLIRTLQAHAQWLLKAEWERIKYEARSPLGKIWKWNQAKKLKADYLEFYYGPISGMTIVRRLNKA